MNINYYLLISLLAITCITSPPQKCLNLYTINNLPSNCTQTSCSFDDGLDPFIVNGSILPQQPTTFMICIILPGYSIQLTTKTTQQIDSAYILANNIYLGPNYQTKLIKTYTIQTSSSVIIFNSTITAQTLWIQSNGTINIQNCILSNYSLLYSQCSCFKQVKSCLAWDFQFPQLYDDITNIFNVSILEKQVTYQDINFNSIVLVAYKNIFIDNSTIVTSVIGVFTQQFKINSGTLSAEGLGYASDVGEGCGFFDEVLNQLLGCTGSGGSYGGFGGNSSPNNCNLMMSKTPYGSYQKPYQPGSGGGYFLRQSKQSSAGGGIIVIQVLDLAAYSSQIRVDGKGGTQGGGGGAGGTISIDYSHLHGNSIISAQGGKGNSSGSGGRIRLWNHNWQTIPYIPNNQSFTISVNGGADCFSKLSCGAVGSIFTSPCQPGYQLNLKDYTCHLCKIGNYQLSYGYFNCSHCNSKPLYSEYILSPASSDSYSTNCQFVCNTDYTFKDGVCLSYFQAVVSNIGGINLLICLGLAVGIVILYFLIILIRRLAQKQTFWYTSGQIKYSSKKYFQIEELPYHQLRLYLLGNNTHYDPWRIDQKYTQHIFQDIKSPIGRISNLMTSSFKALNQVSRYSKFQVFILLFLKIYYYPLVRFVRDSFKARKAQAIFRIVTRLNSKIPDFESIGVKFHVKPQLSVGCIQIFNYTRSVYDFYIENYFPMFFLLQKLPLGGYCIDFTDPFMKTLINQLVRRQEKGKSLQSYLQQLNQLLRNAQQTLSLLAHLWTANEYIPKLQTYLWQPPGKVLGTDKQYVIDNTKQLFLIFSSQNINNNHFLHENTLPCVYYDQIASLKHKFNLRKENINNQKKVPFWEIENKIDQKILSWMLGFGNILMLLFSLVSFFTIIFILSQDSIAFYYGIALYFIILPLSDFLLCFLSFKAILSRNPKLLSYSIFFSVGLIIKFLILSICAIVQMVSTSANSPLIKVVLGVWLLQFLLSGYILLMEMFINPHYLKR